jgi:TPR repeat protein
MPVHHQRRRIQRSHPPRLAPRSLRRPQPPLDARVQAQLDALSQKLARLDAASLHAGIVHGGGSLPPSVSSMAGMIPPAPRTAMGTSVVRAILVLALMCSVAAAGVWMARRVDQPQPQAESTAEPAPPPAEMATETPPPAVVPQPQPAPPTSAPAPAPAPKDLHTKPEIDPSDPLFDLKSRAAAGDPAAAHDLGVLFAKGDGVKQDWTEAARWFRRAAELGSAKGQYNYAVMLQRGLGMTADPGAALDWYRRAAEAGLLDAQYTLAISLIRGIGGSPNATEGARWLEKAATLGDGRAATDLARLHETGLSGSPDYSAAIKWYRRGIELKDSEAAPSLATLMEYLATLPADKRPADVRLVGPPTGDDAPATRAEIAEIQKLLNMFRFDAGTPDGLAGAQTTAAIRAFQEAMGLKADGRPTRALTMELKKLAGEPEAQAPNPAAPDAE